MQMDPSGGAVGSGEKVIIPAKKNAGEGLHPGGRVSPMSVVKAEEVAVVAGAPAKGKKSKAKKAAPIDLGMAETIAWEAKMEAMEAAKVAKAKAEEAEEAARIAKAKAEEAAKAREAVDEARRLKDKETEWAQSEEELLASMFRGLWNQEHTRYGAKFLETTSIRPMRYTYPTPEEKRYIRTMETLQIISLKIKSISGSLKWPLQVFGIVAARDIVDHKRNIIFQRQRNNCQVINQNDPYLALTGPSRAVVVSMAPSHIEISLKVKGGSKSDDKDLSELVLTFISGCVLRELYPSRLSTMELKYDHIMCAVEATIRIKVTGGSWPDGFRGVFTAFNTRADDLKVKLLDFGGDGLPVAADGMIKLSRSVVSVGLSDTLKVSAMAYPINDDEVVASSEVALDPEMDGITTPGVVLKVGSCSMEVSVAWSLCNRFRF